MIRRLPIRARLALGSALMTFLVLVSFGILLGAYVPGVLREDLRDEVTRRAQKIRAQLAIRYVGGLDESSGCLPDLAREAAPYEAQIRVSLVPQEREPTRVDDVVEGDPNVVCQTERTDALATGSADFFIYERRLTGVQALQFEEGSQKPLSGFPLAEQVRFEYAEPYGQVSDTVRRIRLLIALGVLLAGALAYAIGTLVARRAMEPIARLTHAAGEIARTRDPGRHLPQPEADDEVAELAATLEEMLQSLDQSRAERERVLDRQRQFVADASHELRTPLTSIQANLELLAEHLAGEDRDAAASALRSSRRMGRLVEDLLLLARSDAGIRRSEPQRMDLAAVLRNAADEVAPLLEGHELVLDLGPAELDGSRDELHRVAVNLLQNAVHHTPRGTRITARTMRDDGDAVLEIADDGPGIPPELRARIFERFVRGGGDRVRSTGLGLAIVKAVADSHGGSVALDSAEDGRGTRFRVRLPGA